MQLHFPYLFYNSSPPTPSLNLSPLCSIVIDTVTIIYHLSLYCSHLYHNHYSTTINCILLLQMLQLHVYIIIFIGIQSIESSSNNILYIYIVVVHTNRIQYIWIRQLILPSEAAAVCIQEGWRGIRLYTEL